MTDNDRDESPNLLEASAGDAAGSITVGIGNALPVAGSHRMPVLQAQHQPFAAADPSDNAPGMSRLAEGLRFEGNAHLGGLCSVGGEFIGNLMQQPDAAACVVVTESGRVTGDITAHRISVMGRTEGVLDAGQGEVTLHDSASVKGLVRYGRIQVNGADLNATLERVAISKPAD